MQDPKKNSPKSTPPTRPSIGSVMANHPVVVVLGLIGSVLAVGEFFQEVLKEPEIGVVGSDVLGPFVLPFTIKNSSHFLKMRETTPFCRIEELRTVQGGLIEQVTSKIQTLTLGPSDTYNFTCDIGVSAVDVKSARVFISAKYRTIWWNRASSEEEFTWDTDATPARWVQGRFLGRH